MKLPEFAAAAALLLVLGGVMAWSGYQIGATHGVCPPMGPAKR